MSYAAVSCAAISCNNNKLPRLLRNFLAMTIYRLPARNDDLG
ncbi:hypothetical protein RPATATE_0908 [Rickettsia parkeri str. Tate's Hell]|uniref:Uncharacterized protein n=2 Tax=spotted fever group TaxID=114277 RepID=A0ABN4A7P3_RICS1|nr:hypothetical protein Rsl_812 [Rickettsia slovaca 13-B]KJV96522.1 hypothetical protein RPAAT24_0014 [Rickettsia parkeri str. AT\